jgi:acyl dehydratase
MGRDMMANIDLSNIGTLKEQIGKEIAVSEWRVVSQEDIDQFGQVTGDDHWIHTDQTRSTASSPYGMTIAQGLLSLCLLTSFSKEILNKNNNCVCINYGFNRVRFPAPVRIGQRVRAHLTISSLHKLVGGGSVTWAGTVEIEHGEKPACYAEIISQFFFHQAP